MCRLLIVVAVALLSAGPASATHRPGSWGSRYCLQGHNYGYPGRLPILDFTVVPGERFRFAGGRTDGDPGWSCHEERTADNTLQLLGAGLAVARAACRCGIA